jgi:hypothetical protein
MNSEKFVGGFGEAVTEFLKNIEDDPRIGPGHISLFLAILQVYKCQEMNIPVSAFSKDLMRMAKISAAGTFRKCIWDLHEFGFINYIPSYNPLLGGLIYLLKRDRVKQF